MPVTSDIKDVEQFFNQSSKAVDIAVDIDPRVSETV
jgi:hypothetical protein